MITGNEQLGGLNPFEGLTIRQHFAVMAMAGMLASGLVKVDDTETISAFSVSNADALINELNKP